MVNISANFRHTCILSRYPGCGWPPGAGRIRNGTIAGYFTGAGIPAILTGTLPMVLRLVK